MKFFIKGQPIDYQGAREMDPIYQWIQKKTGPASKHLTSDDEFNLHSAMRLSVLYVLPEDDMKALDQFMAFAAGFDDVPFAHSTNPEHSRKLEISKPYGFVVFRNFDEGHKFMIHDEPLNFQ